MKKVLLYTSLVAIALLIGVAIVLPQGNKEYYQPRSSITADEGITGALQYMHAMRANQVTGEVSQADVLKARKEGYEKKSGGT
ncbi:MAG: hypothetical protein U5L96_05370 [Owenweeksia sp.]|nr:hypothetical protein [Owenweeksia sp.]